MTRCAVRILRVGACTHPAAMAREGASFAPAVFPALAGLIIHPVEGPILFDTGYDPAFLAARLATARFFAENELPHAAGLVGAITAGAETLYAAEFGPGG